MYKYKASRCIGLVLAIILLTSLVAGMASAHMDSMNVILTYDSQSRYLSSGETAKVIVHVFDKGDYADADKSPTLAVECESSVREVETDRISAGKYEGIITIMDSDVEESDDMDIELKDTEDTTTESRGRASYYGNDYIEYAVSKGRDSKSDTIYNYVTSDEVDDIYLSLKGKEKIEVSIEICDYTDYPFEPGDTIDFIISVTENDVYIEPGDFELVIEYYDNDGYEEESLSYNNPSAGLYEASYKIPSRFKTDTTFTVGAKVEQTDDNNEDSWDDTDYFPFELNFFEIWYHEVSIDSTQTRFEIWVADINGLAVSGAEVFISYEIYKTYDYEDTDSDGFSDKFETDRKTDPNDDESYPCTYEDSDYDGYGDAYETKCGTDPNDWYSHPDDYNDTDYDWYSDEEEEFYGSDPDDPNSEPYDIYSEDSDYDLVCDEEEDFYGTDPDNWDSSPKHSEYLSENEKATTDSSGKTSFTIDTSGEYLDIDGYVKKSGFNQTFSGRVDLETDEDEPTDPEPYGYGFEILSDDNVEYIDLGKSTVTKRFIAYLNGEKIENGDIYYYMYTSAEILKHGTATTTATGKFTITFKPPTKANLVYLQFETATGDHPELIIDYGWEDSDYDGFSDKFEDYIGTGPDDRYDYPNTYFDTDNDDYSDEYEDEVGTDPTDYSDYPNDYTDSDGDYYSDEFEISEGSDPNDYYDVPCDYEDTDYDGFSDEFEAYKGTDPTDYSDYPNDYKDSDGDDFGDAYEISCGTNPNNDYDYPTQYPKDTNDTDSDGHYDGEEEYYGTDPDDYYDYPYDTYAIDSDYDGHRDIEEGYYGTDPNDYSDYPFDTYEEDDDWDGHSNAEEIYYGTDPTDYSDYPMNTYGKDSDYDGYYDCEEIFYGTDPDDSWDHPENEYEIDTDYDGVGDLEEEYYGTDPENYASNPKDTPSPWDPNYSDHVSNDGKKYEQEMHYLSAINENEDLYSDGSVDITVSKLKVGGKTKVTVNPNSKSVDYMGGFWHMGTLDDYSLYSSPSEDQPWKNWGGTGQTLFLVKEGKNYVGYVIVPDFLPGDDQQKYTIGAGYIDYDTGEAHINHITMEEGQSRSTISDDDEPLVFFEGDIFGIPLLYLIIMIIVIVIVIIGIVAVKSKAKKKRGAMGGPPAYAQAPPPPGAAAAVPPPPQQQPPPPPPPQAGYQPTTGTGARAAAAAAPATPQAQQYAYQQQPPPQGGRATPPQARPAAQPPPQPYYPQQQQPPAATPPAQTVYQPQRQPPPPPAVGYTDTYSRPDCSRCGSIMTTDDYGRLWCPNCGNTEPQGSGGDVQYY